jgi:hypothetical protein
VLATAAGLAVFTMAPSLCRSAARLQQCTNSSSARNTFFHYTTGISVGILLSVLLMTFLLQRRFQQSLFSWVSSAWVS